MKNQGRRAMDRFPVTEPLTMGMLHSINRAPSSRFVNALCFIGAGAAYGGGLWVVANWLCGA